MIKKIFKKSVAMCLIRRGHDLKDTETNLKNNRFKVFLFEENQELLKDLTEITLQLKQSK
ncbi:DUF5659 domain-containing protein [Clostridium sp. 001]|uniref:DUF5659 domain-containing protein n=1 Tax=Clostridium sp. 001 TaxID=1970093 RepID=UPI001C2BAB7E|nr:DUF5659 domain-containing protein [Clostridium sp. 001]QXE20028.1 hypothetical protein B5S50_15010 [Clostridium sp. 001]